MRISTLGVLGVGVALLLTPGCGKSESADDGAAAAKSVKAAYALDERGREETLTRTHVSGRVKLAGLPVVVTVSDAPKEMAAKVQEGFCKSVTADLKLQCTGPREAKVRLWVSEVDVALHEVSGSVVVDLISEVLLNEGWETADLRLRYGVGGPGPDGVDPEVALGEALGRHWSREVKAYLGRMGAKRTPSTAVRWVAAPGFTREETWPLDYGMAELVGARAWTFQRGNKTKQRVGYLINEDGEPIRSETFETTADEGELAGWGTRTDPGRNVLLMALTMTAADKDAVDAKGGAARFVVIAMTRGGEARISARGKGQPASPPLILGGGDIALVTVTASGDNPVIQRVDGVSSKQSERKLAREAGVSPTQYDLIPLGRDVMAVIPAPPGKVILKVQATAGGGEAATKATPTPKGAAPAVGLTVPVPLYTWRKRGSATFKRHQRLVVAGGGALILLDGDDVVAVGADGAERFRKTVKGGVLELAIAGDVVAVMRKDSVDFLKLADGALLGSEKRRVYAVAKAGGTLIACGDPGLVAYDGKFKATRGVKLDDHCETLAALPEGEVMAGRFLWIARVKKPQEWAALPTAK